MWTAPVQVNGAALPAAKSPVALFMTGMALTIGNPKIMVFCLALLPSLIDLNRVSALGLAEFVAVAFLVMMTVDLAWAFAAAWARRWLKSPRAMRAGNHTGARAMAGAAAVIAMR
jgi:threonine/homoserine/homoserine lactone efflux protein